MNHNKAHNEALMLNLPGVCRKSPWIPMSIAAVLTTLLLTACQEGTDLPGSGPSGVDDVCAGPTSSQYMHCGDYQPPTNLRNQWRDGGWDAG